MQRCRSGGPPSWRKRLPTTLSAAAAHARAPGTPTPHQCAAPRQSPPGRPPGRGAYVPSNTHSTSRATYGSRVLSNMVSGRTAT